MTDCGCEKAKAELEEYLHNELRRNDAADIQEHLASCPDCSSEHLVTEVFRSDLPARALHGLGQGAPDEMFAAAVRAVGEVLLNVCCVVPAQFIVQVFLEFGLGLFTTTIGHLLALPDVWPWPVPSPRSAA